MKIKAYSVKQQGGKAEPFIYERKIGKPDVLVKITHCGIAMGDIQIINNDWGDTKFPLVPGHEIIGIIEKAGSAVKGLKNGDRVGVGYQQGKFCLVAQPLNKLSLNAGLLYDYAQRTIYGNYTGSRKNMKDMLAFSARHNIESDVDVLPFSKMNKAIEMVKTEKILRRLVLEIKNNDMPTRSITNKGSSAM